MPPATVGPALLIEPPLAFTPLMVGKSRAVSYSHRTLPSCAAYARRRPSIVPEKTTPGIAVTAAGWDGLQALRSPQGGFGALQIAWPSLRPIAAMPPLASRSFGSKNPFGT